MADEIKKKQDQVQGGYRLIGIAFDYKVLTLPGRETRAELYTHERLVKILYYPPPADDIYNTQHWIYAATNLGRVFGTAFDYIGPQNPVIAVDDKARTATWVGVKNPPKIRMFLGLEMEHTAAKDAQPVDYLILNMLEAMHPCRADAYQSLKSVMDAYEIGVRKGAARTSDA